MLADELEQFAEGAAAALFGHQRGVLAGRADQAAQLLHVGFGVRGDPARRGIVVGDQFGAPALGLVQRERILGVPRLVPLRPFRRAM